MQYLIPVALRSTETEWSVFMNTYIPQEKILYIQKKKKKFHVTGRGTVGEVKCYMEIKLPWIQTAENSNKSR